MVCECGGGGANLMEEKRQLSFMTDICQAARCASCLCAASLSLSLQARRRFEWKNQNAFPLAPLSFFRRERA